MLLRTLGVDFEVRVKEVNEDFPEGMEKERIPVWLAETKAIPFLPELSENDLLITADTIVWIDGRVLGKPDNFESARQMLTGLSGREHQVISGVCLTSSKKQKTFFSKSIVCFKELTEREIDYYITHYKPFDKAGAYGIQEWIGYIGITRIEGSFYNVMGLPVQELYTEIINF